MIFLDAKAETSQGVMPNFLSLLGSEVDEKGEPKLSFLELLNGVKLKPEEDVVKFIPLQDSLPLKDLKQDTPLPKTLSVELNPMLVKDISPKDLKQLIFDAKAYLKTKIVQSDDFKLAEVKKLPKTLKGLVAVANKLGIDVKKITLEEVQPVKLAPRENALVDKQADAKVAVKFVTPKEQIKQELKKTSKIQLKQVLQEIPKEQVKQELKEMPKVQVKQELKPSLASVSKLESKQEVKAALSVANTELKETPKPEIKQEPKQVLKPASELSKPEFKEPPKIKQENNIDVKNEVKASLPLFREVLQTPQKVLTQNIVNVKQHLSAKDNQQAPKTIKQKADETLKLLLRGEKPQQSLTTGLTADFSVATSRVIAPKTTKEMSKSFESLLQNSDNENFNLDSIKVQKVDNFSVKLNEAKQMVQYLSQDIKTAIDDYKSPFMRLKVQLNPQNLGEVDLTIVSRGKNLHVNIGSNNAAINALAMNVNELKTQLNNNGINNATFNFNSGSNGDGQSQNSQQNHQNQQRANEEYNYFEVQDEHEEILNSLEIVVPNYA